MKKPTKLTENFLFIVRYDLFSSLLYKSLLIDKQHNYLTSKSLKIK